MFQLTAFFYTEDGNSLRMWETDNGAVDMWISVYYTKTILLLLRNYNFFNVFTSFLQPFQCPFYINYSVISHKCYAQAVTMIIHYTYFFSDFEYKTEVIWDTFCVLFMKRLRDLCFLQYFTWPEVAIAMSLDGILRLILLISRRRNKKQFLQKCTKFI